MALIYLPLDLRQESGLFTAFETAQGEICRKDCALPESLGLFR